MADSELSLTAKSFLFAGLVGQLLVYAVQHGLKIQLQNAYRSAADALVNAKRGTGIAHSLHLKHLAIDILVYREDAPGSFSIVHDGHAPEYQMLGDYWKTLNPLCRWGGDFPFLVDGWHFSVIHEGIE